jgi:hypothetical protein
MAIELNIQRSGRAMLVEVTGEMDLQAAPLFRLLATATSTW